MTPKRKLNALMESYEKDVRTSEFLVLMSQLGIARHMLPAVTDICECVNEGTVSGPEAVRQISFMLRYDKAN